MSQSLVCSSSNRPTDPRAVDVRRAQDSTAAYPAYVVTYRRCPGVATELPRFPVRGGPQGVVALGEAAVRVRVQPLLDAAASAAAAAAAEVLAAATAASLSSDGSVDVGRPANDAAASSSEPSASDARGTAADDQDSENMDQLIDSFFVDPQPCSLQAAAMSEVEITSTSSSAIGGCPSPVQIALGLPQPKSRRRTSDSRRPRTQVADHSSSGEAGNAAPIIDLTCD